MKKRGLALLLVCVMVLSMVQIAPVAVSAEEGEIIITPTAETCFEFTGWTGSSGLKRYDGKTTAPIGGGVAKFEAPATLSGWTDIYYWIPSYASGYTSGITCTATVILTDAEGNEKRFTVYVDEGNGGYWAKIGCADLSATETEIFNVTTGSGTSRLTNVKFVPGGSPAYVVTLDDFTSTGGWKDVSYDGAYNGRVFQSESTKNGNAVLITDKLPAGEYYVYVHSVDFAYRTGARPFCLVANGAEYRKTESLNFGTHLKGTELENTVSSDKDVTAYFNWEKMGYPSDTITVGTDGKLQLELKPLATFARVDGLLLTTDPDFVIFDTMDGAVASCERFPSLIPFEENIPFPENAKGALSNVTDTAVLSNDYTTVSFKKGTSAGNRTVVQREIKVGDVTTVPFENGVGFLGMYANSVINYQSGGYYGVFNINMPKEDGTNLQKNTSNVFYAGAPEWLVPNTLEQIDPNTVRMTADGTYVSLVADWTLTANDKEPKVTVTYTVKKDGEYSFGLFNEVNEIPKSKVGYVLNPYRWQESRYPSPGVTITETNATTDHTQMTYKINDKGQEISLGVAIDQSSIDLTVPVEGSEYEANRWVHDTPVRTKVSTWTEDKNADGTYKEVVVDYTEENADFVMNTTGVDGGILPAIFAPKMASMDSAFKAGETYTVSYRPLSTVSTLGENRGWYDMYRHVATDLRGVYDYRDNYFSSMTDAAFNILNLMKDDWDSGWSDEMIGHYNIEDSHWATNSNGLTYLQAYMLTEDKDLLFNRTLPTMGSMLTRSGHHIHRKFSIRNQSEGGLNKEIDFTTIGMGSATFEGAYLMTQGIMPVFREISKKRVMLTGVENAGMNLQNSTDYYWYERANGSTDFPLTIQHADLYNEKRAFISANNEVDRESFINISYTPQFQAQFDAYELTGDTKYLEGAVEGARRFLPSLRITDMPESKSDLRVENTPQFITLDKYGRSSAWSYDDFRYRRGAIMENTGETVWSNGAQYNEYTVRGYDENAMTVKDMTGTYPAWVTARTGLGVEQFSTCLEGRNILMSTWAGDVLRLGYLSDDQLMMDLARSSIVGRFANYPGYYYTSYTRLPSQENYPTEGFDMTSLYFHHIPVFFSAVQDYLFSNAWVKSGGKVDFPNTRIQGYAWFNNRMYGHAPGVIYNETDMWPWLKEGTIEVSSKQIDWIAGRKNGRAAFVLTNAGDNDESITVTLNPDLGVQEAGVVTLYDASGAISTTRAYNNEIKVTVPAKGILTLAVDGANITVPAYSTIDFDEKGDVSLDQSAIGMMYQGNTYKASYSGSDGSYSSKGYSPSTGYDVKAYALAMDTTGYLGYIFVGGRSTELYDFVNEKGKADIGGGDGEDGIIKSTLKWHYEGDSNVNTVVDDVFPYEFWIPVEDSDKKIVFTVETQFKNETKSLGKEYTIAPKSVELEDAVNKTNFAPISMETVIQTMGGVSAPLTQGNAKFCIYNTEATQKAFAGFNFMADDALKDCYLNGYLKVNDIDVTDDITESGYLLFDNVKIVQSRNNATKTRVDFSIADPFTKVNNNNLDSWAVYDKDGKYLGVGQNMLSIDNQAHPYEWENLYLTNSATDNSVKVAKDGNTYTISCNGAKYVKVLTVTYSNGVMTDVQSENVIVSINNPKVITVNANQKVMVWDNVMYEGSTFAPILPVMTR
ncbi:MAG: hypothetical protein IJE10_09300 [Clostridia bacterium]|nr:hypothetical protein [Clostridia bacterium]